ncbi:MAG: hypothetical protein ACK521_11430 [bacterium]
MENPFIKLREKALRKNLDSKVAITAEDLEKDNFDNEDIILLEDENKFVIKDLEQEKTDKLRLKKLKRQRLTTGNYLPGEEIDDDTSSDDEGAQVADLRKKIKD